MSSIPPQALAAHAAGTTRVEMIAVGAELKTLQAARLSPGLSAEDRRVHDARISLLMARFDALRTVRV